MNHIETFDFYIQRHKFRKKKAFLVEINVFDTPRIFFCPPVLFQNLLQIFLGQARQLKNVISFLFHNLLRISGPLKTNYQNSFPI